MAEHMQHAAVGHSADDQYLETPPGAGYEHTDASVGPMVKFAFWLVVAGVVSSIGLAAMYGLMIHESVEPVSTQEFPLAVNQPARLPPPPTLQQFPGNELYDFRTKEEIELNSYGWVDKDSGTVHIPIQDAMRLTLERGLPARPQGNAQEEPVGTYPSDSSSGRVLEKRRQ